MPPDAVIQSARESFQATFSQDPAAAFYAMARVNLPGADHKPPEHGSNWMKDQGQVIGCTRSQNDNPSY